MASSRHRQLSAESFLGIDPLISEMTEGPGIPAASPLSIPLSSSPLIPLRTSLANRRPPAPPLRPPSVRAGNTSRMAMTSTIWRQFEVEDEQPDGSLLGGDKRERIHFGRRFRSKKAKVALWQKKSQGLKYLRGGHQSQVASRLFAAQKLKKEDTAEFFDTQLTS